MANNKLLTAEEILQMSDDDYMDERQLAFFRNLLVQMENELRQNADQTTVNLRETTVAPDPTDRATIEEEHALELRTRDRERKLLKKVEAAIRRIDEGEYGYCEETGDPIGVARLMARPTATLSLEAQQRREALIAAGEIPPDAEPVETAEAAIPTGPEAEPDSGDYAPSVPPAEYETVPQEAEQPQEPAHTPLSRPLIPRHPRTVAPPAEEDEPEEEELTLVDHGVHAVGTTGSATGRREVVDLMDDEDHER